MSGRVNGKRRELLGWLGSAALAALTRPGLARAAASPRVVIVGAGFGGATCARYLRLLSPHSEITVIDARAQFLTGPFTNEVVAGLRPVERIRRDLKRIGRAHQVRCVNSNVLEIDPVGKRVRTADGRDFGADCIIVSPGVAMRWDIIDGLSAANSAAMPHAWLGDAQVVQLRERLRAVADGDTVLIGAPANPYRCPPGPYERASLMADALLRTGRKRCKIFIADAKDDFTKSALFKLEWDNLYPGLIEWLPRASGGEVVRVSADGHEVWLKNSATPIATALSSIVPAQQAAAIAVSAGLTDESGWCPVKVDSFESTRHPGVYVLGDASAAAPMPKSAFSANSQAKLCASAIAASFAGAPAPTAELLNTCYSLVSSDEAISVSAFYRAEHGKLTVVSDGMSPLSGDIELRRREARQASAWYDSISMDSFGAA